MEKTTLREIEILLQTDDFPSADELMNKLDKTYFSKEQNINMLILKGKIKNGLLYPDVCLILSDKAIEESVNLGDLNLEIDSLINKLSAIMSLDQIDQFLLVYNKAERKLAEQKQIDSNEFLVRKADLLLLKGMFFEEIGEYDESLNLYKKANEMFKKQNLLKSLAISFYRLANIVRLKGDRDKAMEILKETLPICEKSQSRKALSNVLNSIGSIYWLNGKHKEAIEYHEKSLVLNKEMGNKSSIARILNNIGTVHYMLGELNLALDYYEEAIANSDADKNEINIAFFNYNIGIIYQQKGELDKALENMTISLRIIQKAGRIINIIAFMNSMGKAYHQKGDFEQALAHLQMAHQLRDKIENNLPVSKTLYYLISVCLDENNLSLARKYFEELQSMVKIENNQLIAQRAIISEALLLKLETRSKYRVKAEELLYSIIRSEIIDIELYIDASLNLTEMLLLELKMTNNIELLAEVKSLTNNLLETAKKQKLQSLLAEIFWLQSQIALIEFEIKKARQLLNQAETIAADLGFERLGYRISKQHDMLLDQIDEWELLVRQNAPLIERMDAAKLEEFLLGIFRQRTFDIPTLPEEEPIMLLFLKSTGIPIYSKNFFPEKDRLDDSLISGFLTAINAFIREAFEAKGSVERIKHNEYTLIIQTFDSFLMCYIFKGQSFSAMRKVSQFISLLKKDETLWQDIEEILESAKPLSVEKEALLKKIVDKVFPVIA